MKINFSFWNWLLECSLSNFNKALCYATGKFINYPSLSLSRSKQKQDPIWRWGGAYGFEFKNRNSGNFLMKLCPKASAVAENNHVQVRVEGGVSLFTLGRSKAVGVSKIVSHLTRAACRSGGRYCIVRPALGLGLPCIVSSGGRRPLQNRQRVKG